MHELIDLRTANLLMAVLAGLLPVVGAAAGAAWGMARGRLAAGLRVGLMVGAAAGVGNWILWRVYNAITDHLGLDTVRNLFANLALFVGIGVAAGVLLGLRARRARSATSDE